MTTVYKVFKGRVLGSEFACGAAFVSYRGGNWISAPTWLASKGYHLLVFEKKTNALYWAAGRDSIWECEADGLFIPFEYLPPRLELENIRDGFLGARSSIDWISWSCMVERLRLVKRIS